MLCYKLDYEVRLINCSQRLDEDEQRELEKIMKNEGYILEDIVEYEIFGREDMTLIEYRFMKELRGELH